MVRLGADAVFDRLPRLARQATAGAGSALGVSGADAPAGRALRLPVGLLGVRPIRSRLIQDCCSAALQTELMLEITLQQCQCCIFDLSSELD
jgi:hypothetical protein